MDESKRSAEEEATKRAELCSRFEGCIKVRPAPPLCRPTAPSLTHPIRPHPSSLARAGAPQDVQQKLEAQGEERLRIIRENETLRGHLEKFLARADLDKERTEKLEEATVLQRKLLEAQLAEAAHARAAEEARANVLRAELDACTGKERELVEQLRGYADKFADVEKMLQDSNAVRRRWRREGVRARACVCGCVCLR